jgi:hypothetical protein
MKPTLLLFVLAAALSGCVVASDNPATVPPTAAQPAAAPATPQTGPAPELASEPVPVPQTPASQTPGQPAPDAQPFQVSLERTACFGRCPMYVVTVAGDGQVTFAGKDFVAQAGTHQGDVDTAVVDQLRQAITDAGFFAMNDCYCERRMTDMPSVIITVQWGERQKTVKHYTGDHSAPAALIKLQEQIDALAGSERWVK